MSTAVVAARKAVKPIPLPRAALPVDPEALATGRVLAFDGALAKTGWAVVERLPGRAATVLDCGLVRTTSDLKSHEQTFARADLLADTLAPIVRAWEAGVDEVVCERPAVAGMRIESSLFAAYAVHRLVGEPLVLVSRQHAVRVFCGPGRHTKAQTKAATVAWAAPPAGARFNQDVADAVLVALTRLYDRAQEEL